MRANCFWCIDRISKARWNFILVRRLLIFGDLSAAMDVVRIRTVRKRCKENVFYAAMLICTFD